ncbi:MAG: hypothetical protein WDK96_00480 [Candidatus Paceibacterota bacterium]|jgi:hypothetical protein
MAELNLQLPRWFYDKWILLNNKDPLIKELINFALIFEQDMVIKTQNQKPLEASEKLEIGFLEKLRKSYVEWKDSAYEVFLGPDSSEIEKVIKKFREHYKEYVLFLEAGSL